MLGAYPDHGMFVMPNWKFKEVNEEECLSHFDEWVSECGVSMLGGCCGLGQLPCERV